jgi:hypothetical protein
VTSVLLKLMDHPRLKCLDKKGNNGWVVTLKPGWKSNLDPLCPTHTLGAGNLSGCLVGVKQSLHCDCLQCQEELNPN